MTLQEIIAIANKAYPDDFVDDYFDPEKGRARDTLKLGDTLARFIVVEICETYDANASDAVQVAQAMRSIKNAEEELREVSRAFETKLFELM